MAAKKIVEEVTENKEVTKNEKVSIRAVVKTRLNFRKRPGTDAEVIRILDENEEIIVISNNDGWSKIKAGTQTGYVMSEFIEELKGE